MRTRTLLLLAVGCGLLILGAGVALLLQLAGPNEADQPVEVGRPVPFGDLAVTVERFEELGTQAIVTLEIGGVDDPDGAAEFRLVVPGSSLRATGADGSVAPCGATTVEVQRCSLTFDVSNVEGSSRVLLYRRGDDRARWSLAAP